MEEYQDRSLRGRVFEKLREDILSGVYKDCDELREITIGEEMGVSRTPVREAFRKLELEGLVTSIPNKGTYVNGISREDVQDIYMIRSRLEGLAARLATRRITKEQIDEMDQWEGSQLNQAKEILAYELTNLVHGEEEAKKAQESARALFTGGNAAEMPTSELTEGDFVDGKIDILGVLVKSGLSASRSEARRAVEQGGVVVADEKVTDVKTTYAPEQFDGEGLVVRRGKKNFKRVVMK